MKAAIYTQYGPPEVVSIRHDRPRPVPKASQVLVRVHAAGVNQTDAGTRSAVYVISRLFSGLFRPRIPVLGCEFAGEVVEVGSAVTAFKVGDRVFGFDEEDFGTHAEYKIIAEKGGVAHLPPNIDFITGGALTGRCGPCRCTSRGPNIDFITGGALTEGGHYALCNKRAAKIKAGYTVLVYGATGAIGSAAVQLLRHMGVYVVAVAGTAHQELVRSLGANEVIDYQTQDFVQACGQHKFDVVYDAVGKSSFGQCKPLLKPKGLYMSTELGKRSENIWRAIIGKVLGGRRIIFPIPVTRKQDIELLADLAHQGKFRPLIDRTYPLDDIVAAYR